MRRKILFGILFFVLLLSFGVSAACPSNQTIMKLSSETNAHGELWNGTGNYAVEICYNKIFGRNYVPAAGVNPHIYNAGTNTKIIQLSEQTNAHASLRNTYYGPFVFYGDLKCRNATIACNADEELVVSLSSVNNAHISASDDYPVKICCTSGVIPSITGAYWSNMVNSPINTADLNDSVKLVVAGLNIKNKSVSYTIKKQRGADWINWLIPDSIIAQSSSKGWLVRKMVEPGKYYFTANIEGIEYESITNIDYGTLTVSETENNAAPVAVITNPKNGTIYFTNESIEFKQASYDEDDYFTCSWNFGDRSNSAKCNTLHTYTSGSQKDITLTIKDSRGKTGRDSVSILVLNKFGGKGLFADINYPLKNDVLTDRTVNFNASTTYAVDCRINGNNINIECLAGSCPEETSGITVINITGTPNWAGFEILNFNWTFIEGPTGAKSYSRGDGKAGASPIKEFDGPATFDKPHKALVSVILPD